MARVVGGIGASHAPSMEHIYDAGEEVRRSSEWEPLFGPFAQVAQWLEQHPPGHPRLVAGEARADAEVRAGREGEVRALAAADVVARRIRPVALVAVRGRERGRDWIGLWRSGMSIYVMVKLLGVTGVALPDVGRQMRESGGAGG